MKGQVGDVAAVLIDADPEGPEGAIDNVLDHSSRLYWCNAHRRQAVNRFGCDPNLGGILLPCRVVDLTEECTIERR